MKIRRFRLRGAQRFPVLVEPPPVEVFERMVDALAGALVEAKNMGFSYDEVCATLAALTGTPAVVVPETAGGIQPQSPHLAQIHHVVGACFGITIPTPKKDAAWPHTAEF